MHPETNKKKSSFQNDKANRFSKLVGVFKQMNVSDFKFHSFKKKKQQFII